MAGGVGSDLRYSLRFWFRRPEPEDGAAGIEPAMEQDHGWCHSLYYLDTNGIMVVQVAVEAVRRAKARGVWATGEPAMRSTSPLARSCSDSMFRSWYLSELLPQLMTKTFCTVSRSAGR